jgi:hypothetical protein
MIMPTHAGIPAAPLRRLAAIAGAAAILVAAVPATGRAQPLGAESGRTFGQHVASCARDMGFDGAHNPGMHQGFAGWPGDDCPQ